MSEPFIGEIRIWAFNFAPKQYAFCDGTLLMIAQNTTLFSVIGTYYGGDGTRTFGLPDLRGRCVIHPGQGPGLTNYPVATLGGAETHTLLSGELAPHSHTITTTSDAATSAQPTGARLAKAVSAGNAYGTGASPVAMAPETVGPYTGGGQPHSNMQPFLTLNFCIALEGAFPSRH